MPITRSRWRSEPCSASPGSSTASASGTSLASCATTSPTRSSQTDSIRSRARCWDAFHSIEAWTRLEQAIQAEHLSGEHGPLTLAIKWLDTYGQIAKAQIPTRDPHGINSTGPVEQILREIDRRIGERVGSFTNRTRLSKLLDLMTLDLLGKADGRDWADRLRERLYLAGGRPTNQRPHDDPKGVHSLFL